MSESLSVIWHDVECGSYEADLPLWEELAERQGGTILELGCGTGRVALHLARRGHRVIGVDRDPDLILELAERGQGLPVEPVCADALDLELDEQVSLALAPMQFLQLLNDSESRARCLRRVANVLRPGGLLAAAIVGEPPVADNPLPPLPDVREVDGWVYSSLPITINGFVGQKMHLHRLRQIVSPDGDFSEEKNRIQLLLFESEELREEAESAGFSLAAHGTIPPTEAHVGSIVVLLERTR